jgi:hypothetical protein
LRYERKKINHGIAFDKATKYEAGKKERVRE